MAPTKVGASILSQWLHLESNPLFYRHRIETNQLQLKYVITHIPMQVPCDYE